MESDIIRSNERGTTVDLWIDGSVRTVTVLRAAIESHLRLSADEAAALSDDERGKFVRANLGLIMQVATTQLQLDGASATEVLIGPAELAEK